jgi:hypothetical protein
LNQYIGMFRIACALLTLLVFTPLVTAADIGVEQTARLIRLSERGVDDTRGWARDLLDVLRAHDFDRSRENVCAAIAVIDQESSFRADPAVPNLGALSEQALREKFGRIPIAGSLAVGFLETTPTRDDSYMLRIRNARTERDLDLAYRSFIEDASNRASLSPLVQSGLLNSVVEQRNDIDTAGSMQVSVAFALATANKKRWLPMQLTDVYAVRDDLYSRRGGMYYGVLQLLGYNTGYAKKIYRFADYNAGRYASRNAGFQRAISELTGEELALDGDLLIYDKGKPALRVSASEAAIRQLARKHKLGLDDERIRKDLTEEKNANFIENRTYSRVRDLYFSSFGREAPYAVIPQIRLDSVKIKRVMTTAIFAEQVNRKYQACMGFKI